MPPDPVVTDYVALLGRINVGGRTVTMADLRAMISELGYLDVGTYIQTGNVFFRAVEGVHGADAADRVAADLERHLGKRLGYSVPAFVRTVDSLVAAAATDPFAGVDVTDDVRLLVLLMSQPLPDDLEFPVVDEARGLHLIGVHGREAFIVLRLVNGRPGNAVAWFEKRFGVRATARFAHTLARITAAAHQHLSPAD